MRQSNVRLLRETVENNRKAIILTSENKLANTHKQLTNASELSRSKPILRDRHARIPIYLAIRSAVSGKPNVSLLNVRN